MAGWTWAPRTSSRWTRCASSSAFSRRLARFGQTSTPQADHYVFADYLADLDMLLDHYAPGQAVDLVGHSMGGNVAMMYAGVRPERIRRLVNLEGFGMPATPPGAGAHAVHPVDR